MTTLVSPLDTIRDYRKRGYSVELIVDSNIATYTIRVSNLQEVKNFVVSPNEASIEELCKAIKGL